MLARYTIRLFPNLVNCFWWFFISLS